MYREITTAFLLEFFCREGTRNLTGFYSPQFEQLLEAARNTVREEASRLVYAKNESYPVIGSEALVGITQNSVGFRHKTRTG